MPTLEPPIEGENTPPEYNAVEAEYHIRQLTAALDRAERRVERLGEISLECNAVGIEHPPHIWDFGSGQAFLCPGDERDPCPGLCGEHHWLDRPESDTRECLICGREVSG